MATETRSRTIPPDQVASVLLELERARPTGLLEVYGLGRVFRLALRRGVPIHASPGEQPWRLGDVMAHLGHATPATSVELRRALATRIGTEPSGERLCRLGLASRHDVARALKEQLRLRAQEFLLLDRGRYRLFAGRSSLLGVPRQPDRWSAQELVAAVRRHAGRHEALRRLVTTLETTLDPLQALGLPPGADDRSVRAAFRALAKAHHPDHLGHVTDPEARRLHSRAFEAALAAYQRASTAQR